KCEFLIKKAEEMPKIIKNKIAYVSHLDKIFDEILGEIKICNDGYGIRVHKWIQDESIYIPLFIFGKLLLLDYFNDNQKNE
ncbi:unnamed protein product, partial [Rotaria magnacalcarata]